MRYVAYASILVLALSACVKGEDVRRATYPPNFNYLTESEVRGTMGELAMRIAALDELMSHTDAPLRSDKKRIVENLEAMQSLVRELTKGAQTNHPQLDRAAPLLERKVDRALFGARRTPPNYYFAGMVSGACSYCHAPRHQAAVEDERPAARPTPP